MIPVQLKAIVGVTDLALSVFEEKSREFAMLQRKYDTITHSLILTEPFFCPSVMIASRGH